MFSKNFIAILCLQDCLWDGQSGEEPVYWERAGLRRGRRVQARIHGKIHKVLLFCGESTLFTFGSFFFLFKHLKLKVKICHFLGTGSSGNKRFYSCALCLPYFWQRGTGAAHANLCVLAPRWLSVCVPTYCVNTFCTCWFLCASGCDPTWHSRFSAVLSHVYHQ